MPSTHGVGEGTVASEEIWGIMCLISHYSGGGGFRKVHRAAPDERRPRRAILRRPARACEFPCAVCADSAAEASYVPAAVDRSSRSSGADQGSGGGDMTSKRMGRIAGWMLAPLLVAGVVTPIARRSPRPPPQVTTVTTRPCTSRRTPGRGPPTGPAARPGSGPSSPPSTPPARAAPWWSARARITSRS